MKERWSITKEKLVSVEAGLVSNAEIAYVKPVETSNACKQLILYAKLILCLKLLLFVGWTCYSIWQIYRIESMEVKVTDTIRETELQSLFGQHLTYDRSTNAPEQENVLIVTKNILQAPYAQPEEIFDVSQDEIFDGESNTTVNTTENNLQLNRHDSILRTSSDEKPTSPNAENVAVLEVDTPDSAERQLEEHLKVNESKENVSDRKVSTSALAADSTEEESEENLTSVTHSSSDEDAINYQSDSEDIDETLVNSDDDDGLTAIHIANSLEHFYTDDASRNLAYVFNSDFDSYSSEAESLWDYRRRFMKRSGTSETSHKERVGMDMDNEEEKSNDHLAPQLLKEKVQNDIVSRLGHKITRSINNGVSNKGTSLNELREYVEPTSVLYNAIHEKEDSIATVSDYEEELMENDLNKLFRKMEVLAAHIDKLHERFLRLNELNDDYISKEFSSEYFE